MQSAFHQQNTIWIYKKTKPIYVYLRLIFLLFTSYLPLLFKSAKALLVDNLAFLCILIREIPQPSDFLCLPRILGLLSPYIARPAKFNRKTLKQSAQVNMTQIDDIQKTRNLFIYLRFIFCLLLPTFRYYSRLLRLYQWTTLLYFAS